MTNLTPRQASIKYRPKDSLQQLVTVHLIPHGRSRRLPFQGLCITDGFIQKSD